MEFQKEKKMTKGFVASYKVFLHEVNARKEKEGGMIVKKIKNNAGLWYDARCPHCGRYPQVLDEEEWSYDCGCAHPDRVSYQGNGSRGNLLIIDRNV